MICQKNATRGIIIFLLFFIVFVSAVAFFKNRVLRSEAGICERSGLVVDEDQLRKKAFVSFIYKYTTLFFDKASEFGEGGQRLGIIRNIEPDSLKDRLIAAANRAGSIEQRLSITRIEYAETRQSYQLFLEELELLKGLFAFVVYSDDGYPAGATIYFSDEFSKVSLEEVGRTFYTPSVYEKYMGYGDHYFRAGFRSFLLGCCGGKKTNEKYDGVAASLREIDRTSSALVQSYSVVSVSNCGDVLDEARESHSGYRQIKWIRGN